MTRVFENRREAGTQLAELLWFYASKPGVLVLGLPRGGVPVAYEVARTLGVPLDVFTARKLGVPSQPELAMGAVATGGVCVIDEDLIRALGISAADVERVRATELAELERRERRYRGDRPPLDPRGSIIILVDDGLATGATMHAAVAALRQGQPHRIVVAVPVASHEATSRLRAVADEIVVMLTPPSFHSVGTWYRDFAQTTDDEVQRLLEDAARRLPEDLVAQAGRADGRVATHAYGR